MIDEGKHRRRQYNAKSMRKLGIKLIELSTFRRFTFSPGGSSERIMLYYAAVSGAGPSDGYGGLATMRTSSSLKFPSLMRSVSCARGGRRCQDHYRADVARSDARRTKLTRRIGTVRLGLFTRRRSCSVPHHWRPTLAGASE